MFQNKEGRKTIKEYEKYSWESGWRQDSWEDKGRGELANRGGSEKRDKKE